MAKTKSRMMTFRVSEEGYKAIHELSERLSREAKIHISLCKTVEVVVFHAHKKPLHELLKAYI